MTHIFPARRLSWPCALLAASLLSGCASDHWIKPGASNQELEYTMAQCKAEGYATLPNNQVPYQVSNGYYTTQGYDCQKNDHGSNDCNLKKVYQPPVWSTRDANGDGRQAIIRACMMRQGWMLQP